MSNEIKRVSANEIHQISEADLKRFEELYGISIANKTEDVECEIIEPKQSNQLKSKIK